MNRTTWQVREDGTFALLQGERPILCASAHARDDRTGTVWDTRECTLENVRRTENGLELTFLHPESVRLVEQLTVEAGYATARLVIRDGKQRGLRVRSLTPLSARDSGETSPRLWRDPRTKMLLVPYDNDMWMRYEAVALHAGLRSSDVTCLFRDADEEALLIGAMDFDVWKNAIACPGTDARMLEARCGEDACGEDTHDAQRHGALEGMEIASSRFLILSGQDARSLLENYGRILGGMYPVRRWDQGVPFGWNCYAALGRRVNASNFRSAGDFLFDSLMPLEFQNQGTTYVNLDGGWQVFFTEDERKALRESQHARGQKAGIYDAPFACFSRELDRELPLMEGHTYREILLRDGEGRLLPRVDGSLPYDLTHPVWQEWTRRKAERILAWGYDYLKIDFLSHGAMEGIHHDPAVKTGRQALKVGYDLLSELYDQKRIGRPFFLSLSIAPLFPFGTGNARRFSCDAFGLTEDVEYVLNAQTYAWWTGGTLYEFNDPDHIVLLRSFCMDRDATPGEARARYTSAVISGTMMLLSDDYTRKEARERTLQMAGNAEVNALARAGRRFRPGKALGTETQRIYVSARDRENPAACAAVFGLKEQGEDVLFDPARLGLPGGRWVDLWTGDVFDTKEGAVLIRFETTDARLLQWQGA